MSSKPVKLVNITNDLLQQQTAPADEECPHCAPNPDGGSSEEVRALSDLGYKPVGLRGLYAVPRLTWWRSFKSLDFAS